MDYKQINKSYSFNVYKVVDLDLVDNNALFNGWLLTSDYKYCVYSLELQPCRWCSVESLLTA